MQKHEVINAIIENGYYLEKMDEFGMVTFGKTTGCGDIERRKIVEVYEDSKGTIFHFYKTIKTPSSNGHSPFGEQIYCNLNMLSMNNGVITDEFMHEFVL